MRKLGKILSGPESEHLGLGYNPAHSQRPCLGGHGRGLDRVWSRTLSRLSIEWGMKIVVSCSGVAVYKRVNFMKHGNGI